MWQPERITFTSLFAHKHSSYEFRKGECVVIFGSNETDKGMENNGAGKTTLFEAICIALTGDSLRSIKKDAFINRDENDCRIEMELSNQVLKTTMKIVRHFYRGSKTTKVELYEGGELNTQMTSANEINKRIVELLGITREDLLNYYIISQDNTYVFFTASDVDKKDIMNRITSANMIKPVISKIDDEAKRLQAELGVLDSELNRLAGKIEAIEEQRQEWLNRASESDEIAKLKKDIEESERKIGEVDSRLSSYGKDIITKTEEISRIKITEKPADLRAEIRTLRDEKDALDDELSETHTLLNTLNSIIGGAIECPNCSHEFLHGSEYDMSLEEARESIPVLESEVERIKSSMENKQTLIDRKKKKLEKLKAEEELKQSIEDELKKLRRKEAIANEDIEELRRDISRYNQRIEELKKSTEEDKAMVELLKKKKGYESDKKKTEKSRTEVQAELDIAKYWQFNMGKNGFMTYLANKSVKVIEGVTNSFLERFGVDLRIEMTGFTILKSGEVREKIDVFVQNDGFTSEPFMSKSGGERGRVALAGVLAIQHLINLSSDGRGLDLLLFDECFKGLDSRGQESIIKIFEGLGLTTMVITQNVSDEFNIENVLLVEKKDGVSRYIN